MKQSVIGVKQFLEILNETLAFAYPEVIVEGEVSQITVRDYNVYIELKDDDAVMSCYIYRKNLKVEIEEGMRIRLGGSPKVLSKYGKFSFTARWAELAGEGELKRAFELLKQKLEGEGLFDPERKRPIPPFPASIGLVTADGSAAQADFLRVLSDRWGGVKVLMTDVKVQGPNSPDEIVAAFQHFNQMASPPDTLVLIRGGGSLEDLQAFNTEQVARAVAASRIPTIVGVGHEVDISLADFAADKRAVTPTDAARLAVPDRQQVTQMLAEHEQRFRNCADQMLERAETAIDRRFGVIEKFLAVPQARIDQIQREMAREYGYALSRAKERATGFLRLMKGFDPQAILKRGYSIVYASGKVVKRPGEAPAGTKLVLQLAEGKLKAVSEDGQE